MRGEPPPTDQPPPHIPEQLFEAAYRTLGTAVLGYALRRSATRETALDVVADTFATAWRRREDMPSAEDEVRPWLFGIARLCQANANRSAGRAERLNARLASTLDPTALPDPAAIHESRAASQQVLAALAELPDDDRELLALTAWEGLTPGQAAAALGLQPGTARVRLHRIRTRLRAALYVSPDPKDSRRDQ